MDPWILPALAVLGLALAGWFWLPRKGARLEIEPLLKELGKEYSVVTGVILRTARGMIRIDYVVVSPYGLFLVHERLEPGRVDVQPGQREWPVSVWRKQREALYNPLWRSRQVINDLQEKLGELPMISLVVFLNARLQGPEEPVLVLPHDILRRIRSFSRPVVSAEDQQKALAFLRQDAR